MSRKASVRFRMSVAREGVMCGLRFGARESAVGLLSVLCAVVTREVAVSSARPASGGRAMARAPRMLGMGRVRWLDLWSA